ncbi:hypothetical protein GCM10027343_09560 [Noviherbaspirillum agri]
MMAFEAVGSGVGNVADGGATAPKQQAAQAAQYALALSLVGAASPASWLATVASA